MPPLPSNLREFDDTDKTRELIYKNALGALSERFPVEDDDYRLELSGAKYTGPQTFTLAQQKDALMKDRQLRSPITAKWRLVDKASNAVLDEREDVVMHVPYYTQRGTFVHKGNEYSVVNQARLKPGAYVRKQRTGEVETHFNVRPNTGKSFRLHLEPKTGVFKVNVGQSNIPLFPLLKSMGVTEKELLKQWGPELTEANMRADNAQTVSKLYKRFSGYKYDPDLDAAGQSKYLAESLPSYEVDPDVVARTMGITDNTGVTPALLMRATQKMLNVSKGEEESDDRDAPEFSQILGVEDFVRERIEKDAGRLSQSLLWKTRRGKNLKSVRRGALNPYMQGLINGSGLAMPLEETNPLHTLEQAQRIIKLGEGGISSAESITDEARDVNPGQFGFIDPINGPEGLNIGIDVRAAYNTFKGDDGKIYGEFTDTATGKSAYVSPDQATSKVIAFPGEMAKPGATAAVMVGGKVKRVPKKEVDLEVPSFGHMMSANTNLNPMPTAVQAGRQFYGSKFWSQYLPQVKGEVPLVDSLMPDGKSTFSEHYGRKVGSISAKRGGTVSKVTDQGVTVIDDNGKKEVYELIQDFPFNRLTGLSYMPAVKAGDKVNVGDMVAHSNFTDKTTGALNMGNNLRTAVVPARGMSYEDAYVISESAAKKMSTERLYGFDQDAKHGVELSTSKFISAFPQQYSKGQIEKMDKDGIIKRGTTVNKGDPLILATGPKLLSSSEAQLGKLHKVLRKSVTDKSVTWDHSFPGVVTDIAMTRNGAKVNVKTAPPVAVGDKMSTRFGLKGVVGKVMKDEDMPRDPGSNEPYELLLNPMTVLSRVAPNQIIEMQLAKIAKKTGKQVRIPQLPPEEGWAAWAEQQLAEAGIDEATPLFDPKTGKNIKPVGDGYVYVSAFHHLADKKLSTRGEQGSYTIDEQPARGGKEGAKKFCFVGKQPIEVLGGEETIAHIVEQRASLMTRTFDGHQWTHAPIIDWFARSCHVDDLVTIKIEYVPTDRRGRPAIVHTDRALWVTKGHELYAADMSKIRAKDVRDGDWLAGEGYVLDDQRKQLLLGSMLGDGAICVGKFYSEQHSCKQANYLDWKQEVLGAFVSNRTRSTTKRTGYKPGRVRYMTIHRPDIVADLQDLFYHDGRKCITQSVLDQLGDMAVAAWVLDDGSITNHSKRSGGVSLQGNIATMGFATAEVQLLSDWLNTRYGGTTTVTAAGAIYVDKHTAKALSAVVAANCPARAIPRSKRWLYAYSVAHQENEPCLEPAAMGVIPMRVRSVSPYVPDKSGTTHVMVYDMTVADNHRYKTAGVLVSNSRMDVNAALAHGATEVIRDVMLIRGTKNEEYWKALKLGRPLPEPGVPFIYDKFLSTLKAGGINIREEGDTMSLLPMMDEDVDQLSKGRIDKSSLVDSNFEPIPGGLFDVGKTGGMAGNRWTHVELPEPVPNPVMEEPIRRILGLRVQDLKDVVAGRKEIDGKTGGAALKGALDGLDIDEAIEEHKKKVQKLRGANRDNSVKILGYLSAAKKQGIHPSNWMISKVPVLPPKFRPVSRMGDIALQADLNELYRDLIESTNTLKDLRAELPDTALADERQTIYDAVTSVYGLGESITPEGRSRRLKGAIRQVIGTSPKRGLFQSRVLSRPVDVVGRGVVTPNPNLDMDSVGIPADAAWTQYKDFVMRRLVRRGYPALRALELIDKRTPEAKEMLDAEMQNRPIILDRAPTWHKFNLMAFYPHIVDGDTIQVSPLITNGFNMDFDGDQANFHVPVSDKAVEQASRKMLPSKNLFSLTDLKSVQHTPTMEMVMGLYWLTQQPKKKKPVVFATAKKAQEAYAEGKIDVNDPVVIQGM